ncbi:hypothetical protein B4135_3187 [Caldibacillus debilis]|uniref:Uncharacterized protein n=1 Tax=Caldibacillus debilis TaxID=301148 RepID=A0A150LHB5_9BACI|nr:hypothetical protein B4135_3187 [Caldibacillus debilis]
MLFGTRPRPCMDREDREGEPADMRMADGASLESEETRGKPGCRQICGQPKSQENIV